MTRTWWAPKDIHFTEEQVVWLLENLPLLREGKWPPEPGPEGIESPGVIPGFHLRRHRRCAAFETPCEYAAEIEQRLQNLHTDEQAVLVYTHVCEWDVHDVISIMGISYDCYRRRYKRGMEKMTGLRRRRQRVPTP